MRVHWAIRSASMVLSLGFLTYFGVCAFMFFKQSSLVYFPLREHDNTPAEYGLPFEDVALRTSDGVAIHAWWLPTENPRGAVVVAHGNGGNISHRLDKAQLFHRAGFSVLLFDYRGYGKSTGEPSEEGTYADMSAAVDHVLGVRGFPLERLVFYGESLGGAVAVHAATQRTPGVLVVESSFTSLPAVGAHYYPWLPVKLLMKYRYDSLAMIASVKCPVMILHSPADEIIPNAMGRALFQAAKPPKQWVELRGGHNDGGIVASAEAQQTLSAFFAKCFP